MGHRTSQHPQRRGPSCSADYHLQFRNPQPKAAAFKEAVNVFLNQTFDNNPPLKYERHSVKGESFLVRFRLHPWHANKALETAGKKLCQQIFLTGGKHLNLLTKDSLLGVSAACEAWEDFFNRAFFDACLEKGHAFLKGLKVGEETSYVPVWATVLAFVCFAGLNFTIFTSGGPQNWWQSSRILLGSLGVNTSADILERAGMLKKADQNLDIEAEQHVENLDRQLTKTAEALEKYYNQGLTLDRKRPKKVRKALFNVARVAANAVISNQKLLQTLKQKRLEAITQMAGRAGGFAVSAWTFWNAFAFTTEVTGFSIAPVSTWLTASPLVVETATVATCINPLVACAAAGFGAYHLVKANWNNNDQKQLELQVEWYEHRKSLMISAWSVASDTEIMLRWIHCTKLIDPKTCLTADDYHSDEKKHIIEKYEKMANFSLKKKKEFVGRYLKQQKKTLISIQESLKEDPQSSTNDDSSLSEVSNRVS